MLDVVSVVKDCSHGYRLTLSSFKAGLAEPKMSSWAAEVNSGKPAMGRYSWLRLGSLRRISSALKVCQYRSLMLTWYRE